MMRLKMPSFAAAIALLACSVTAHAQDSMGIDQATMAMSLYAGSVPIEFEARRGTARPSAGRSALRIPPPGAAVARMGSVSFGYRSTPALRQQVFNEFIGRLRQKNPSAAAAAQRAFAGQDYGRIYSGIVAPFGLGSNDAADSLTAYLVLGWLIANGADNPGRGDVGAARAQIAAALARDPRFSGPSRGKLGEEFKLLFVTLHSGWQSARREGTLRQYSTGVARLMQQQAGLDLRAVRLAGGFQMRG